MSDKEEIYKRLGLCEGPNDIEAVFKEFQIGDSEYEEKSKLLRGCMKIKHVYAAPVPNGEDETSKDAYEDDVEFFVDGHWRQFA